MNFDLIHHTQMLKDEHPHLVDTGEPFVNVFRGYSLQAGLGLRHFKCSYTNPHASFYNARRISPVYSHTPISLSLLNSQGLISQNRNECQFLQGLITSLPSEHIIAITETHLTAEYGDGEITKSFEKYTVHRSVRNTEIGRKTKNGGYCCLPHRTSSAQ